VGGGHQQLLTNNERTALNMRPPTCPPIFGSGGGGHWHTNSVEGTPSATFFYKKSPQEDRNNDPL